MSGLEWFICGTLAWQAITVLVCIVTDDDATVYIGIGVVGWVVVGVCKAIRNVIKLINSKRYVSLIFNAEDNKLYYCSSWHNLVDKLMEYSDAYQWANDIRNKYKPSDGWRKHDCCCDCVNMRYTPIKIAKAEGAIPVDRVVLRAAKQAYNKQ